MIERICGSCQKRAPEPRKVGRSLSATTMRLPGWLNSSSRSPQRGNHILRYLIIFRRLLFLVGAFLTLIRAPLGFVLLLILGLFLIKIRLTGVLNASA